LDRRCGGDADSKAVFVIQDDSVKEATENVDDTVCVVADDDDDDDTLLFAIDSKTHVVVATAAKAGAVNL
jgi:hypothetical protein